MTGSVLEAGRGSNTGATLEMGIASAVVEVVIPSVFYNSWEVSVCPPVFSLVLASKRKGRSAP